MTDQPEGLTPDQVRFRVRQIEGRAKALVSEVSGADFTRLAEDADDLTALVDLVAEVQNARRELAALEGAATMVAGRLVREGAERDGYLPDGRQWTLHRTADRKAWRHDEWKHAARAKILFPYLAADIGMEAVDPETGELVELSKILFDVAAKVQEVHGSTAPRTGVLKALGLTPGDYCEQVPGNWKLDTIAPTTTEEKPA